MTMSDTTIIALVTGLPAIIAAIASAISLILHGQLKTQVDRIESNTNSITDTLVQRSGQLEYRKGVAGENPGFPENLTRSNDKEEKK